MTEDDPERRPENTANALAITSLTIATGLMSKLVAKNIISRLEAQLLMAELLAAYEALPPGDPVTKIVRGILEVYSDMISDPPSKGGQEDT